MESTSSLRDMQARMEQWINEKPSWDNGINLRVQENDIVLFQFVASGNDGDQFIKAYRSHAFDGPATKRGRPTTILRYCLMNGEGVECQYCTQNAGKIKERMSIWMYVQNILHTTMPPEKQYPQVNYEGRFYFNEEVNDFKIWHTSAWKDSPWSDIVKLAEVYKGLHNFTAQMVVVGQELTRRFKVYAMPNSPSFPDELYARAKAECEAIPNILKKELATPVALNPQAAPQQQMQAAPLPNGQFVPPLGGPAVANWAPAPTPVTPFVPAGVATAVPTFSLGSPLTPAPQAQPVPEFNPVAVQTPVPPAPPVPQPQEAPLVEDDKPPFETKEGDKLLDEPVENPRRPLQKLF